MTEKHAEIYDAIEKTAEYIESFGNRGEYHFTGTSHAWVLKPKYKPYRDGILFYSRGHGWRVRRQPAWKDVLAEKRKHIPATVKLSDIPS